jgi:hypothetical protein
MSDQLRLRPEAVAWREVDGDVIALGLESSRYFGTNASGAVLWRRLAEGTNRGELIETLMTTFGLEEAQAQTDVDAFLDDLRNRDLLTP